MKQRFSWITLTALSVAIVGCAAQEPATGGAPAAPAPESPPAASAGAAVSVYDGVYTAAQATRGNQTQQRECASCHSANDWSQGRILQAWQGQTAYDFVANLRATMPMDAPGRLSLQQYTDILAFMLELNNIPAGDDELPADEDALELVQLEYRR